MNANQIKLTITYHPVTRMMDFQIEPELVSLVNVMTALVAAQLTVLQTAAGATLIGPDGTPLATPKPTQDAASTEGHEPGKAATDGT